MYKSLQNSEGLYGKGFSPQERSQRSNTNGSTTITQSKSTLPKRGTPYGDGYWDGYEEGYDDIDSHNDYGFKYDESTTKYSGKAKEEYIKGYRHGYKEGWEEGLEDLEAFEGEYYEDGY